jgi:photosystem II stability/assembly factor-like uncharacterized protein
MPTLYVGTIGQSVWRSVDGGETFHHACRGMWFENDIRALIAHPEDSRALYAGAEDGVFRSTDGGDSWARIPAPADGQQVWSIAFGSDPATILVGMCPAALYRSNDGGESWEASLLDAAQSCFDGRMLTRVTCILAPRVRPGRLFAGVEVDGPRRSTDGGATWQRVGAEPLRSADIHDMRELPDGTLVASTNNDLYRSRDGGDTWESLRIKEHFARTYCRGMVVGPDGSLFVGVGDGPPGSWGAVYRTRDGGDSWRPVALGAQPNSTVWLFATAGDWILAATVSGHVYRSADAGERWEKLPREFGEIRGLLCVP